MNDIFQSLHDLLERKRQESLVERLYSAAPDRVQVVMVGIGGAVFMVCLWGSAILPALLQPFVIVFGAGVFWVGIAHAFVPMILVGLRWSAEKVVPHED